MFHLSQISQHTYLDVRVRVRRRIGLVGGRAPDGVNLLHDHITVEPQLRLLRLQLRSAVRQGGDGRRGAPVGNAAAALLVVAPYQAVLKKRDQFQIVFTKIWESQPMCEPSGWLKPPVNLHLGYPPPCLGSR